MTRPRWPRLAVLAALLSFAERVAAECAAPDWPGTRCSGRGTFVEATCSCVCDSGWLGGSDFYVAPGQDCSILALIPQILFALLTAIWAATFALSAWRIVRSVRSGDTVRSLAKQPAVVINAVMLFWSVVCIAPCIRRLALGEQSVIGMDWANSVLAALGTLLVCCWCPMLIVFSVNLSLRMPLTSGDPAEQARARALLQLCKRGAWLVHGLGWVASLPIAVQPATVPGSAGHAACAAIYLATTGINCGVVCLIIRYLGSRVAAILRSGLEHVPEAARIQRTRTADRFERLGRLAAVQAVNTVVPLSAAAFWPWLRGRAHYVSGLSLFFAAIGGLGVVLVLRPSSGSSSDSGPGSSPGTQGKGRYLQSRPTRSGAGGGGGGGGGPVTVTVHAALPSAAVAASGIAVNGAAR